MFTVAQHCQIIDSLDLIDSSHKLASIYVISFRISLRLILLIGIKIRCDMAKLLPAGKVLADE